MEDFFTAGAGILDDAPSFAAAGALSNSLLLTSNRSACGPRTAPVTVRGPWRVSMFRRGSGGTGCAHMPTTGTWRAVPALAAPIQVSASGAPQRVSGDVVRASTFASATTGWAAVRADTPPISCLLRTEDAGTTWTCQLAWSGDVLGRLHAFDGHRASLLLGLRSGFRNEINGLPVAAGEPFYHFVAGTQDAGAT